MPLALAGPLATRRPRLSSSPGSAAGPQAGGGTAYVSEAQANKSQLTAQADSMARAAAHWQSVSLRLESSGPDPGRPRLTDSEG